MAGSRLCGVAVVVCHSIDQYIRIGNGKILWFHLCHARQVGVPI